MNDIHKLLGAFITYLDDNSMEYNFDPHDAILDFKETMKKDLYDKMEIIIYKNGNKIIYDDTVGVITYYNNQSDCVQVNTPITLSVQDIYKKMELICISLGIELPK